MAIKKKPTIAASHFEKKAHKGHEQNRFCFYNRAIRIEMAKLGMLTKYNDFEAFCQSVQMRFKRNFPMETLKFVWSRKYFVLPTHKAKDEFLKDINNFQ